MAGGHRKLDAGATETADYDFGWMWEELGIADLRTK